MCTNRACGRGACRTRRWRDASLGTSNCLALRSPVGSLWVSLALSTGEMAMGTAWAPAVPCHPASRCAVTPSVTPTVLHSGEYFLFESDSEEEEEAAVPEEPRPGRQSAFQVGLVGVGWCQPCCRVLTAPSPMQLAYQAWMTNTRTALRQQEREQQEALGDELTAGGTGSSQNGATRQPKWGYCTLKWGWGCSGWGGKWSCPAVCSWGPITGHHLHGVPSACVYSQMANIGLGASCVHS